MTKLEVGRGPRDGSGVSVLQVVAYNLRRARELREMSQKDLGDRLERLTGTPWSPATISMAEAGWRKSERVRRFDANEIVAFAYVLRVPVPWFFLPPPVIPHGYPTSTSDECWIATQDDASDCAMSSNTLASYAVAHQPDLPWDDIYMQRLREEMPVFEPKIHTKPDARARRLAHQVRSALDEYESDE